jgi:NADH-quinone oxidoreductase subunit B
MAEPTALASPVPIGAASALTTTSSQIFAWARSSGRRPFHLGLACCAVEATVSRDPLRELASPGDAVGERERSSRSLLPAAPGASDVLLVAGTVSEKLAPWLRYLWEQMPPPKWAVAVGACASCGGPFATYAVTQGVDRILPIDLYIPGCPPSPEALLEGLQRLAEKIAGVGRPR